MNLAVAMRNKRGVAAGERPQVRAAPPGIVVGRRVVCALALVLGALASVAAEDEQMEAPASSEPASISRQDAANIVRQAFGGRIVAAVAAQRVVEGERRSGFRVRVDVRGRVKSVFVDSGGRIHEDEPRKAPD